MEKKYNVLKIFLNESELPRPRGKIQSALNQKFKRYCKDLSKYSFHSHINSDNQLVCFIPNLEGQDFSIGVVYQSVGDNLFQYIGVRFYIYDIAKIKEVSHIVKDEKDIRDLMEKYFERNQGRIENEIKELNGQLENLRSKLL